MNKVTLLDIKTHAEGCYPRECCGLVIRVAGVESYYLCQNLSEEAGHFAIDPRDYADAEDLGEVLMVVHSHPDGTSEASAADLDGIKATELPWLIMAWPSGKYAVTQP